VAAARPRCFCSFDFFTRRRRSRKNDSGVGNATAYFAFKLPRILTQVYPAASLFAVLIGIGALAEQQEVLAMHTCGVASSRILFPLTLASVLLSVLVLGWNETVVPPASSRARMILDQGIKNKLETGIYNASTIWFQTEQGLLNIDYFDALHNVLYGITLHEMNEKFRLQTVVKVPQAVWDRGEWSLRGGTVTSFLESGDMVIREAGAGDLRLDVAPDDLRRKRRHATSSATGSSAARSSIWSAKGWTRPSTPSTCTTSSRRRSRASWRCCWGFHSQCARDSAAAAFSATSASGSAFPSCTGWRRRCRCPPVTPAPCRR
jgi:lipopolysaccharide export LptBFGC system permease protein LptF